MVNRNAFLLWFEGGRPQGADFSGPSLDQLRGRLAAGESLDAVTKEVTERHRRAKEQQAEERKAQEERERVEREKGAAAEREAQVGGGWEGVVVGGGLKVWWCDERWLHERGGWWARVGMARHHLLNVSRVPMPACLMSHPPAPPTSPEGPRGLPARGPRAVSRRCWGGDGHGEERPLLAGELHRVDADANVLLPFLAGELLLIDADAMRVWGIEWREPLGAVGGKTLCAC